MSVSGERGIHKKGCVRVLLLTGISAVNKGSVRRAAQLQLQDLLSDLLSGREFVLPLFRIRDRQNILPDPSCLQSNGACFFIKNSQFDIPLLLCLPEQFSCPGLYRGKRPAFCKDKQFLRQMHRYIIRSHVIHLPVFLKCVFSGVLSSAFLLRGSLGAVVFFHAGSGIKQHFPGVRIPENHITRSIYSTYIGSIISPTDLIILDPSGCRQLRCLLSPPVSLRHIGRDRLLQSQNRLSCYGAVSFFFRKGLQRIPDGIEPLLSRQGGL